MKKVLGAGAVIFSVQQGAFLLLKHKSGHWEFPKGKMKQGESHEDTMVREVSEETGITDLEMLPFSTSFSFSFFKERKIHKTISMGLLVGDADVIISDEHQGFVWLSFSDALTTLRFQNHRDVLKQAAEFLVEHGYHVPSYL